ncbi:MAG: alpha/beta fold hydrolase [Deltaproteobacteria bacterium]
MRVEEFGTGPALLLLHGMPCQADELSALARALAVGHRVLLPELPGYGQSPRLDGKHDFPAVQAALLSLLRERDALDVALVGFSAGAYRAFALALSGELRVRAIASLSGLAGFDPSVKAAMAGFAQALRAGADLRPIAGPTFLSDGTVARRPEAVARVTRWLSACPREILAEELDGVADAEDLRPRLSELGCPILARAGELDRSVSPDCSRDIARLAPRATLELVPGVAHALLVEDEAATVASVLRAVG